MATTFDELLSAQLMHYFVVKRGYLPVVAQKTNKNEVYLEKVDDRDVQIIRISADQIVYDGQIKADEQRMEEVIKLLKKARGVRKIKGLNIYTHQIDLSKHEQHKDINTIELKSPSSFNSSLTKYFSDISEAFYYVEDLDKEFNRLMKIVSSHTSYVTAKMVDAIMPKRTIVTYSMMALIIMFNLLATTLISDANGTITDTQGVLGLGGATKSLIFGAGLIERLFTSSFLTINMADLFISVFLLFAVGGMTEKIYGKGKFMIITILASFIGVLGGIIFDPLAVFFGPSAIIAGWLGAIFYHGSQNRIMFMKLVRPRMMFPAILLLSNIFVYGSSHLMLIFFGFVGGYFTSVTLAWAGKMPDRNSIFGLFGVIVLPSLMLGITIYKGPIHTEYIDMNAEYFKGIEKFQGEKAQHIIKNVCAYYEIKEVDCKWLKTK